jgi:hypothetical protein
MEPRSISPHGVWIALQTAKLLWEKGDLRPNRDLVIPVLPVTSAVIQKGEGAGRLVGKLLGQRNQELEGVGMGKWLRLGDFDDLSGG